MPRPPPPPTALMITGRPIRSTASSSAKRTWRASVSAVEWTATDRRPMSRQARITRSAISPRLAMSTFLNTVVLGLLDAEQGLTVLDVRAVLDQNVQHLAVQIGLDLVHQLHGLDDADHLT